MLEMNELLDPVKEQIDELAERDAEVHMFRNIMAEQGYIWTGDARKPLVAAFMNQKMLTELKAKFMVWYNNHPDAWNEDSHRTPHLWHVINLIGDLIHWRENPWDWIHKK